METLIVKRHKQFYSFTQHPQSDHLYFTGLVTLHESDEALVVAVRDTGQGIPEEMLEQVFERFYRGDMSRTKEGGQRGSGLGLMAFALIMSTVLIDNFASS